MELVCRSIHGAADRFEPRVKFFRVVEYDVIRFPLGRPYGEALLLAVPFSLAVVNFPVDAKRETIADPDAAPRLVPQVIAGGIEERVLLQLIALRRLAVVGDL